MSHKIENKSNLFANSASFSIHRISHRNFGKNLKSLCHMEMCSKLLKNRIIEAHSNQNHTVNAFAYLTVTDIQLPELTFVLLFAQEDGSIPFDRSRKKIICLVNK